MTSPPKVRMLEVEDRHVDQRVDNYLLRQLKGVPKSRIYRIIRKGEVRVNKKRIKPDYKLQLGDVVRVPPVVTAQKPSEIKPGANLVKLLQNNILYQDEHLLVLNKPAGLSVHGGSGIRLGLIEAMRQMQADWKNLELIHRIDRDTSGCLLIAKTSSFLKHLQNEFKVKNVKKTYLALVHGDWPEALQEVNAPLLKNEVISGERIVTVSGDGKPALTRFRVLARFSNATLVEAQPETGRTHQIRVHCLHAGHPIAGDSKYTNRKTAEQLNQVKRLCLHALAIEFVPPESEQRQRFEAPVAKDFQTVLEQLTQPHAESIG